MFLITRNLITLRIITITIIKLLSRKAVDSEESEFEDILSEDDVVVGDQLAENVEGWWWHVGCLMLWRLILFGVVLKNEQERGEGK